MGHSVTHLALARTTQPNGDLGHHCILLVYQEGEKGTTYHVTGEPHEMHYAHKENTNVFTYKSFVDSRNIAELDKRGEQSVAHWANNVPAPSTKEWEEVRTSCQSWVMEVVQHLIEEGVVKQSWWAELDHLIDSPILSRAQARAIRDIDSD